ncbi:uncharacterized protein LOC144728630 [Lampetra planeri]
MELSCLYVLCLVALASQGVLSEDVTDELVTRNKAADTPKQPDTLYYDYATLSKVGLVFAAIMCISGILILLSNSKRCRNCGKSYSGAERKEVRGKHGAHAHNVGSPSKGRLLSYQDSTV